MEGIGLALRPPSCSLVKTGYHQQSSENEKAFTSERPMPLRTGDIGIMDENENTRIIDRKKK